MKHSQVKLGRELRELPGDKVASPGLFYPDKNILFCGQKLLCVIADNQTLSSKKPDPKLGSRIFELDHFGKSIFASSCTANGSHRSARDMIQDSLLNREEKKKSPAPGRMRTHDLGALPLCYNKS